MKCLMTMFVSVLAAVAMAQEPVTCGARRGPADAVDPLVRAALNPKVVEKLGLTEEQKTKLKALEGDKDELKALQEKVRKGSSRQAELLAAEKVDEAAVLAAMDEVFDARKEIAKRQMKRLIAVKSILTPEQVKAAAEVLQSMKGAKRPVGKKAKKAKADE